MAALYLAAILFASLLVPPTWGQGYGGVPAKGKKHRTTTTTLAPPGEGIPHRPDDIHNGGISPPPETNSISGNLAPPGGSPDAFWWAKGDSPFSGATANLSPPGPAPGPAPPGGCGGGGSGGGCGGGQPQRPGADNPFLSGVRPSGGCGGGGCGQPVNIEGNPFLSGVNPQRPSRVVCSGPGSVCVPRNLCSNGVVIPNGREIAQRGSGVHECDAATQLCCRLPTAPPGGSNGCGGGYGGCSGGNQPQQPGLVQGNSNGNPQQPGLIHGNGNPQQPGLIHGNNNGVPQIPRNPGGQNPNYVPGGSSNNGQYYPGTNGVPIGGSIHDRPVTSAPDRPYTGPQNTTPYPGCAAALKCVQEIYCTAIGIMSDQPVHLTRDQQENRVPLAECADPDTGVVGKCCRDPNYKDPWPGGMMMPGGPPHQQADQCGPTAACTPGYLCADHNKIQPIQNCRVPLDGASGMCCASGQPSQPGQLYPGTSPLPPINSGQPALPYNPLGSQPGQNHPGHNAQPGQNIQPFPGSNAQPSGVQPGHQVPLYPGQSAQPGGVQPGQNVQPFPGNNAQPSGVQPGHQVPLYPGNSAQPGGVQPGQNVQPFPGSNAQPSGVQPGHQVPLYPGQSAQPGHNAQPGVQPGQNAQPGVVQPGHNVQPGGVQPEHNAQPGGVQPGQNVQPFPGSNAQPSGVQPGHNAQPGGVQPGQNAQPGGVQPGQNVQPSGIHPGPSFPSGVKNPQPSEGQFELDPLLPIAPVLSLPNPFPNQPRPSNPQSPQLNPSFPQQPNQFPHQQNPNAPGSVPNVPSYQQPGGPSPAPGQACGIRRQVAKQGLSDIDAGFGEFPWQAIVSNNRNSTNLCSGAIITDKAVITSAHCLQKFSSGDLTVKAGAWKLDSHDQPKPLQLSPVAAIARHPQYEAVSLFNDVAILLLAQPFRLNDYVDTICVPTSSVPAPHGPWVATGWEKKLLQNNVPNSILHQIPVEFIPNNQCQENLRSTNLGRYFILNKSFSCAVPAQPNQDLCKVGVGSPVAQQRGDGSYELSGLYSWDVGCASANNPKAFSNIDSDWVQSILRKPASEVVREEQEAVRKEEQQESLEGVDLDSKPGFSHGYGRK